MATKEGDRPRSRNVTRSERRGRTEDAVSAGGVVYRLSDSSIEIAICGRTSDGVWGLPKGTPDAGETLEQTALREVTEETGLEVRIIEKIGVVEYWFSRAGVRYHKFVHYYLMKAIGGNTESHDVEYDKVEWHPVDDALRKLSFANEVGMVRQAKAMLETQS